MSRVDPLTIAVYPGGKNTSEVGNTGKSNGSAGATNRARCNFLKGAGGYFAGAIDLDCFKFPDSGDGATTDKSVRAPKGKQDSAAVVAGPANKDAAQPDEGCRGSTDRTAYTRAVECKRDRNRLTSLLLKQSDDICVREMGSLTGDQATVNASLNILATAATTTANIVTGAQATSILAGVGTLSTATRSHIDADVYRNTVSYAISRAIKLERERLLGTIQARYKEPVDTFTVDDAIRAANDYHSVCSFYRGLELVLASVEGDQRTRDAQLRRDQIDDLELQVSRYRAMLTNKNAAEDAKVYTDKIDALLDQIQRLALGALPAKVDPPKSDPDKGDEAGKTDQPVPNPTP